MRRGSVVLRPAAALIAVVAVAIMMLAWAGVAQAYIYWSNPTVPGGIGRANDDGTGVTQNFVGSGPASGIAIDGSHIYWSSESGGQIGRANLDGTGANLQFIHSINSPDGIGVDSSHLYWTEGSPLQVPSSMIARANLDGSGADTSFISGLPATGGSLADDGSHIYWTELDSINQTTFATTASVAEANLDGSGVNQNLVDIPNPNLYELDPIGITVDRSYVYWSWVYEDVHSSNGPVYGIGRANIDGGGVNENFIVFPVGTGIDALGLAVDASYIYWADYNGSGYGIGRANLDGSGVNPTFITGLTGVSDVAVCSSCATEISGALTDPSGTGVPGAQVNVTGTDSQGTAVSQQAFTDINGDYQVSLNPGTYSVSPVAAEL